MTQKELTRELTEIVSRYIANADSLVDPQIRINPSTRHVTVVSCEDMLAELDDSIDNVEEAAGAQGAAWEEYTDYQASRDPDFYSVRQLTFKGPDGVWHPDLEAIESIASAYQLP